MSFSDISTKFEEVGNNVKYTFEQAGNAIKDKFQQGIECIRNGVSSLSSVGALIGTRSDLIGRIAKIGIPIIEITETISEKVTGSTGIKNILAPLKGRLKIVKEVTSATNIFERGKDWFNPSDRAAILKNPEKTASRAFLTAGQVIETALFLDKLQFNVFSTLSFSLGPISILGTVGEKLSPVGLLKDLMICISSAYSMKDGMNTLSKAGEKLQISETKKQAWIERQEKFKAGEVSDVSVASWKTKYDDKIVLEETKEANKQQIEKLRWWKHYVSRLEGRNTSGDIDKEISDMKEAINTQESTVLKATVRLQYAKTTSDKEVLQAKIESGNDVIEKTKSALSKANITKIKLNNFDQKVKAIDANRVDLLAKHKIDIHDTRITNAKNEEKKSWVTIAVDVAKLIIITLATICMVVGFSQFWIPSIVLNVIGGTSESMGLFKGIHSTFGPKVEKEKGDFFYA